MRQEYDFSNAKLNPYIKKIQEKVDANTIKYADYTKDGDKMFEHLTINDICNEIGVK